MNMFKKMFANDGESLDLDQRRTKLEALEERVSGLGEIQSSMELELRSKDQKISTLRHNQVLLQSVAKEGVLRVAGIQDTHQTEIKAQDTRISELKGNQASLEDKQASLEAKISACIALVNDMIASNMEELKARDERISALEHRQAYLEGSLEAKGEYISKLLETLTTSQLEIQMREKMTSTLEHQQVYFEVVEGHDKLLEKDVDNAYDHFDEPISKTPFENIEEEFFDCHPDFYEDLKNEATRNMREALEAQEPSNIPCNKDGGPSSSLLTRVSNQLDDAADLIALKDLKLDLMDEKGSILSFFSARKKEVNCSRKPEVQHFSKMKRLLKQGDAKWKECIPKRREGDLLNWACRTQTCEVVEELLGCGVDVNAKQRFPERTALHCTAGNGLTEMVDVLIRNGADMNARTLFRFTPLHLAAQRGHIHVVDALLKHGAKVDEKSMIGNTPLHYASWLGRTEIVNMLLDYGASKSSKNKFGDTPGGIACGMDFSASPDKKKELRELLTITVNNQ